MTASDLVELWDWSLASGDTHASEPHVAGTRELLTVIEGQVSSPSPARMCCTRAMPHPFAEMRVLDPAVETSPRLLIRPRT